MINFISNIAQVQFNFPKAEENSAAGKNLLLNNSIVKVEVIDKLQGSFKILVDGKVFQANLPVNANLNDNFLAKIISTNPFTISLDNLFNKQNLTPELLNALISKLQIKQSEFSEKVLKAFINSKKPIEKNKLNKIIDLLENSNSELNENDIANLVEFLSSNENYYDQLNEEFVKIISLSPKEISKEIYERLISINNNAGFAKIAEKINSILTIDIFEIFEIDALKLKQKFLNRNIVLSEIENLKSSEKLSETELTEIENLEKLFTKLFLVKAYNLKSQTQSDFLIIKNENDFEFFEYEFEKVNQTSNSTFKINLKMMPENLGEIQTNGLLVENNLNLNLNSSESTNSILEGEKSELISGMKSRINISAKINIKKKDQSAISFNEGKRSVNVTI